VCNPVTVKEPASCSISTPSILNLDLIRFYASRSTKNLKCLRRTHFQCLNLGFRCQARNAHAAGQRKEEPSSMAGSNLHSDNRSCDSNRAYIHCPISCAPFWRWRKRKQSAYRPRSCNNSLAEGKLQLSRCGRSCKAERNILLGLVRGLRLSDYHNPVSQGFRPTDPLRGNRRTRFPPAPNWSEIRFLPPGASLPTLCGVLLKRPVRPTSDAA